MITTKKAQTPSVIPIYSSSSTISFSFKSPLLKDTSSLSSTMTIVHLISSFHSVSTGITTIKFTKTRMSSYSINTSWPNSTFEMMKRWHLHCSAWTTLTIPSTTSLQKCSQFTTAQPQSPSSTSSTWIYLSISITRCYSSWSARASICIWCMTYRFARVNICKYTSFHITLKEFKTQSFRFNLYFWTTRTKMEYGKILISTTTLIRRTRSIYSILISTLSPRNTRTLTRYKSWPR